MIAKIERKLHMSGYVEIVDSSDSSNIKLFSKRGLHLNSCLVTFDWIIQRLWNFTLPRLYGLIQKRLTMIVTLTHLYCCFFRLVKAVWTDIEQNDNDC